MKISVLYAMKLAIQTIKKDYFICTPILLSTFGLLILYNKYNIQKLSESLSPQLFIIGIITSFINLLAYYIFIHFLSDLDKENTINVSRTLKKSIVYFPKLVFRLFLTGLPLLSLLIALTALMDLFQKTALYKITFIKILITSTISFGSILIAVLLLIVVQITPIYMSEVNSNLRQHVSYIIYLIKNFTKPLLLLQSFNILTKPLTLLLTLFVIYIPIIGPSILSGLIHSFSNILIFATGYFYYKEIQKNILSETAIVSKTP